MADVEAMEGEAHVTDDKSSPMESVDKALLALEALSRAAGEGIQLGALAAELGLKRNSLHRTLAALRYRGFVVQDSETGGYQLGPAVLRLANQYLSEDRLRQQFHPMLAHISRNVNELCHLGVLDGTDIVYLDKVEPERSIRVWSAIGMRAPAVTTALGRAIIGFVYDDFDVFARKFNAPIPQRTPNTITSLVDVWHEIQISKMRGYAMENQEGQEGVSCLAIPILRAGNPIFAISITAPTERMSRMRIGELVSSVRELLQPRLPEGLALPEVVLAGRAAPA